MLDIVFKPFELVIAECAETAGLEVHHVDQADEVDSVLVEAVPARAFGVLGVALAEHFSVIVENVVLSWHKENLLVGSLQNLVHGIELFGIGKMADVTGVQNELRRIGQGVDLVHGGLERADDVRIRRFVEAHVAIADLHKTQPSHFVGLHIGTHLGSERKGLQHSALNHAERTSAGPSHAFQKSAAVNSVMIVVVLNKATGDFAEEVCIRHSCFFLIYLVHRHHWYQATRAAPTFCSCLAPPDRTCYTCINRSGGAFIPYRTSFRMGLEDFGPQEAFSSKGIK